MEGRYSRNLLFWGEEKQRLIGNSSLLIAGVGGLGATVGQLMARAGIGKLYLVDDSAVDWPDLNRQTLYGEKDVGRKKVVVAGERLACINSAVKIVTIDKRIDEEFPMPDDIDGIADCLDNFTSRFALYRATPEMKFFVHGGLQGSYGQVLTLVKGASQPLDAIFAGSRQPEGAIPVTADSVVIIAGIMANELFQNMWRTPRLLNRCLVADLSEFNFSFLDV